MPEARRTDPQTSHDAAASITEETLTRNQRDVLEHLRIGGPSTDFDLVDALCNRGRLMSPSGCRTRRKELTEAGLIRDSGKKMRLPTGRKAIVWEAVEDTKETLF